MLNPDGLVTDTDVLRNYAGHLDQVADDLKPLQERFAVNGPATISIDALGSRTGWLHLMAEELRAFRETYVDAQSGTEWRLRRIRDAIREAGRLLGEAADEYDRSDRDAAGRTGAAGR
ncbi:type VII secretion target [Micromonospora sp. WMMD1102]|uniref:type VII secretion target n=1 Tax=Micromonospora sp. WMMD1102 TaxID=3016105 RepID=UPI002414E65B|nr:type VII secretion target [Micromonospora sp. WMMD1102]MDG4789087.1 type VII secretion target [Micromonospora sp. WMMD1102]